MRMLGLAGVVMGLLPAAMPATASAGVHDGFSFGFGIGDVGVGFSHYDGWRHDGYWHGGDRVRLGFGYSYAPVYAAPAPVCVAPAPVVCAPAPVVCDPAPVYVQPAPVTVY